MRWRFLSEDRGRDQRDDEADRERLDERHRRVEERILIHDFEFAKLVGFLLNGVWSILLGEQVALSVLRDRAKSYRERFTINITEFDGTIATIANAEQE